MRKESESYLHDERRSIVTQYAHALGESEGRNVTAAEAEAALEPVRMEARRRAIRGQSYADLLLQFPEGPFNLRQMVERIINRDLALMDDDTGPAGAPPPKLSDWE